MFSSQNLTDLLFVELSYVLQDFSFLPLAYTKVFQQVRIQMKLGHLFFLFFVNVLIPEQWNLSGKAPVKTIYSEKAT